MKRPEQDRRQSHRDFLFVRFARMSLSQNADRKHEMTDRLAARVKAQINRALERFLVNKKRPPKEIGERSVANDRFVEFLRPGRPVPDDILDVDRLGNKAELQEPGLDLLHREPRRAGNATG